MTARRIIVLTATVAAVALSYCWWEVTRPIQWEIKR